MQKIKPRVKIDIDNVLNNMTEVVFAMYNERNGTDYSVEDCNSYDFACFDGDMREQLRAIFYERELYERMRPRRYAVQYLFKMMQEFDVKLVTATIPGTLLMKMEWLRQWFPYVKNSDVIVTTDKQWISADYAIDDHLGYLLHDIADRILIDAPWNRRVIDYAYSIRRCEDLRDAYQIIQTLEKEMEIEDEDEI